MEIKVFSDREAMAAAAAQRAAEVIRGSIAESGRARIVAATAASQREFLENLSQAPGIDWERVEAFHLDEYIGLPISHPGSFRKMFVQQLIERTGISRYHLLHGDRDLKAVLTGANQEIASEPIDIAFIGIGENGHLAFNDPPANFEVEDPYIVVELDEACRRQQVGEGWFDSIADVPQRAISMSIRQILRAKEIVAIVPGKNKASAVETCFQGGVTPMAPASILRTHPRAALYLDIDSAGCLDAERLESTIHLSQVR